MPGVIVPNGPEGGVPIRSWAPDLPAGALRLLQLVASRPWATERVVAMPDAHVAEGVAVGTVFATRDVLVPAALGGDLGCGIAAVRLDYPAASLSRTQLEDLLAALTKRFPSGDEGHRGGGAAVPDALRQAPLSTGVLEHARERLARRHLGTLGGGNHFIELDRDAGGDLWVLVHSGSRGLGGAIGAHHCRAAESLGTKPLAGLPLDSEPGQAFLSDLQWALAFAKGNRDRLLEQTVEAIQDLVGDTLASAGRLDVVHNFVAAEEHDGKRLWVHRKGAIAAPVGVHAVIPGSMGTASYLVEGLGEPTSFGSASHGAGRTMTRREARETIRRGELERAMRRVVFDPRRADALVEEAPAVYRDIRAVLESEADLIRPILRLEPIAVFKGR
ncbi:MAG: RtcB family protein [Deltaproteobacteria bacterium]|nr:RtcB family protein [Deltaproteobacteria bacterium]